MESVLEVKKDGHSISDESIKKLKDMLKALKREKEADSDFRMGSILNYVDRDIHSVLDSIQHSDRIENLKEIKGPNIEKDFIWASKIHPSQLGALIPVDELSFWGDDGRWKVSTPVVFEHSGVPTSDGESVYLKNMLLIRRAIEKAIEQKWRYVAAIFKNDDGNFVVQGC